MMNLLIIRENICAFFQKWERLLLPLLRFCYVLVVVSVMHLLFGYQSSLYQLPVLIGVSVLCAFLPGGLTYMLIAAITCVDVASFSLEAAALLLAGYLLTYFMYLYLAPGKDWIILVTMVLLMRLPGVVPFLVAILVGPAGIVPAVCGIVLYYYSVHCKELYSLLTSVTDIGDVSSVSYLLTAMGKDKEMLLFIVVFVVVIMVTRLLYQSSISHSWMIAICVGMVIMILGLLAGGMLLEDTLGFDVIFLGSVISGIVAIVVQFFKGVVDYSRIEMVQFEDDDYYYYVKAIPKITMTKKDINVKKINARHKNRSKE